MGKQNLGLAISGIREFFGAVASCPNWNSPSSYGPVQESPRCVLSKALSLDWLNQHSLGLG